MNKIFLIVPSYRLNWESQLADAGAPRNGRVERLGPQAATNMQAWQDEINSCKADAQRANSVLCLWVCFRKDQPFLRKRKWPWKDSLRGLSHTQTKALLWCNDWSGKSSKMIIFPAPVNGRHKWFGHCMTLSYSLIKKW